MSKPFKFLCIVFNFPCLLPSYPALLHPNFTILIVVLDNLICLGQDIGTSKNRFEEFLLHNSFYSTPTAN